MKKSLKVVSIILCVLLCAGIVFSVCSEAAPFHECIGESCVICHNADMQKRLLRTTGMLLLCTMALPVYGFIRVLINPHFPSGTIKQNLISDKVKITI